MLAGPLEGLERFPTAFLRNVDVGKMLSLGDPIAPGRGKQSAVLPRQLHAGLGLSPELRVVPLDYLIPGRRGFTAIAKLSRVSCVL